MIPQKKGKTPGNPLSLLLTGPQGEDKLVEDTWYTMILGANIQSNLSWQAHLETGGKALLPQARKLLGKLKHFGKDIPLQSRKNLARGMLVSRLNYLQPLWGGAPKSYISKVQVVLNAAAMWSTGLPKKTRIGELMKAAGWMSITEQIKIATATQTWKIVHLKRPLRERLKKKP